MKKAIKISAAFILIILMALTYSSCKKETKKEVSITAKENQLPPTIPNAGGGGMEYNYCQGCGFATNPEAVCYLGDCIWLDGKNCILNSINSYIEANDDGSNPTLNDEFAYFVRDSFLVNFAKGNEYITYYNLLSKIAYDNNAINASNFMNHYNFATEVETTMDNLINGPDDYIPVTATFKAHSIEMIDYYRTVDNSVVFNDVLDIIQEDVTNLEGMTKADIYVLY